MADQRINIIFSGDASQLDTEIKRVTTEIEAFERTLAELRTQSINADVNVNTSQINAVVAQIEVAKNKLLALNQLKIAVQVGADISPVNVAIEQLKTRLAGLNAQIPITVSSEGLTQLNQKIVETKGLIDLLEGIEISIDSTDATVTLEKLQKELLELQKLSVSPNIDIKQFETIKTLIDQTEAKIATLKSVGIVIRAEDLATPVIEKVQTTLEQVTTSKTIIVTADTSPVLATLEALKTKLLTLQQQIPLTVSSAGLEKLNQDIAETKSLIQSLESIPINIDSTDALTKIAGLEKELIDLQKLSVSPNINTEQFAIVRDLIEKTQAKILELKGVSIVVKAEDQATPVIDKVEKKLVSVILPKPIPITAEDQTKPVTEKIEAELERVTQPKTIVVDAKVDDIDIDTTKLENKLDELESKPITIPADSTEIEKLTAKLILLKNQAELIKAEIADFTSALRANDAAIKSKTAELNALNKTYGVNRDAVKRLNTELDGLRAKNVTLTTGLRNVKSEFVSLNTQIRDTTREVGRARTLNESFANSFNKLTSFSSLAGQTINRLRGQIVSFGASLISGFVGGAIFGALSQLVSSLTDTAKNFSDAELSALKFKSALDDVGESANKLRSEFDFVAKFQDLQFRIKFGEGFAADVNKFQKEIEANVGFIRQTDEEFAKLQRTADETKASFNNFREAVISGINRLPDFARKQVSPALQLAEQFEDLEKIPKEAFDRLGDAEKAFIQKFRDNNDALKKLGEQRNAANTANILLGQQITLTANNEQRRLQEKAIADFEKFVSEIISKGKELAKFFEDILIVPQFSIFDTKQEAFDKAKKFVDEVQQGIFRFDFNKIIVPIEPETKFFSDVFQRELRKVSQLQVKPFEVPVVVEPVLDESIISAFFNDLNNQLTEPFQIDLSLNESTIKLLDDLNDKFEEFGGRGLEILLRTSFDDFNKGVQEAINKLTVLNIIGQDGVLTMGKISFEKFNAQLLKAVDNIKKLRLPSGALLPPADEQDFKDFLFRFSELGNIGVKAFNKITSSSKPLEDKLKALRNKLTELKVELILANEFAASFGEAFGSAFDAVLEKQDAIKAFFNSIIDSIKQVIRQLIVMTIQAAILTALKSGTSFGGNFLRILGGGVRAPNIGRGGSIAFTLNSNVTFTQRGSDLVGVLNQGQRIIGLTG